MPQDLFKIAQTWQGGGYLTFIVSTIKKIIVSINTFNMFFPIATTSFPDLLSVGGWHNRPAFTLFSVSPYRINPTKFIILHFYTIFNTFLTFFDVITLVKIFLKSVDKFKISIYNKYRKR